MNIPEVSPRQAAVAFIAWLVLGLVAILVHEERIRVIHQNDIYTDKRQAGSRADGLLVTLIATLFIFYMGLCATLSKTGAYILNITDKTTRLWMDAGFLTTLFVWSLLVPGVIYIRYWLKIKRSAKKPEPRD